MPVKRLRRIKDGLIYPFNPTMAKVTGMEVVMCDDRNRVIQNYGEQGEPTVHGVKYATPDRIDPERVVSEEDGGEVQWPPAPAIPAAPGDFTVEAAHGPDSPESG